MQNCIDINLAIPRLRDLERNAHDGKLFWRVKIPCQKDEESTSVNSPHFFLGSPGYRFILTIVYPGKKNSGEGSDGSSKEDVEASSWNQCIKAYLQWKRNTFGDPHSMLIPLDGRMQIVVYRQGSMPNPSNSHQTGMEDEKSEKAGTSDQGVNDTSEENNTDKDSSKKKDNFSVEKVFKGLLPTSTFKASEVPEDEFVKLMSRQQLKDDGFEVCDHNHHQRDAFYVFVTVSLD